MARRRARSAAPRGPAAPLRLAAAALVALAALVTLVASPATAAVDEPDLPPPDEARGETPAEVEVDPVDGIPDVIIDVDGDDEAVSRTVAIVLLLTVGSVAPGLLLLMTSFTRFVVVMGLAKQALGLQTIPPPQVLVGLSLFLTFFVMQPIFGEIHTEALQPLMNGTISQGEALSTGYEPLREFMLDQTRDRDLQLFVDLSGAAQPGDVADVPAATLIPAFVLSELRTAFVIGFVIFVPFLVIDLVTAAVLMSMGMVMLPPVFISLPLKLLLFVLVDGWSLLVGSLVSSVNGVAL